MASNKKLLKLHDALFGSEKELQDFLKNEISNKDKLLLEKYESLKKKKKRHSPPPEFASLIKNKALRNKYCTLAIKHLEARLEINSDFDKLSSVANMKIYTIVTISLVIAAISIRLFSLTAGLIIGALVFWLISERAESGKKENEFAINHAIPIADELKSDIIKFKEFIAE